MTMPGFEVRKYNLLLFVISYFLLFVVISYN